jgi:hypothetical protein
VESLKIFLGLDPASSQDEAAMLAAVAAANNQATTWRPDVTLDPDGVELDGWPPKIDEGANLYAARVYGRRGSVAGVAGFADLGISAIPRLDPDVRALWELGEFQPSVIA